MSPADLIAAYKAELVRLYGQAYAESVCLCYVRGWFRISVCVRRDDRVVSSTIVARYQRAKFEAMLARLRAREAT